MERLDYLNQQLIDQYGIDTVTGQAMFRVVWANDQTEKRLMPCTDSGIQLLVPEVREVRKYSYIRDLYVLERLVAVPEEDQKEMAGALLSYEPVWAYKDEDGNPLPPLWIPTKFVIDTLYAALGKKSIAKYLEDESPEAQEKKISDLQTELFGNETDVGDALAYREGIVVPNSYKGES